MNSQNKKSKHDLKDTWLCLQCGNRIIPFEKNGTAGIVEGVLFLLGVVLLCVNFIIGSVLILASIIVMVYRNSNKTKICPSCESTNIVPSDSPMASKLAKS